MKHLKKLLVCAAAVVMMMSLFVGCGDSGTETSPSAAPPVTQAP